MEAAEIVGSSVVSSDGTRIVFDRMGNGPAVILVEPALHYRDFSAFTGLVPLLSREFTVVSYDRRGRGASTDSTPYSPDREVDDLQGLSEPPPEERGAEDREPLGNPLPGASESLHPEVARKIALKLDEVVARLRNVEREEEHTLLQR